MIDTWLQVATSVVIGAIAAILADWRGRSKSVWFMIGMLFGPFGLIALMLLPAMVEGDDSIKSDDASKAKPRKNTQSSFFVENVDQSLNASHMSANPISLKPLEITLDQIPTLKWYYAIKGMKKAEGPVSVDTLSQLWRSGQLCEESFVWCSLFSAWTKIDEVESLKNFLQKEIDAE